LENRQCVICDLSTSKAGSIVLHPLQQLVARWRRTSRSKHMSKIRVADVINQWWV